MAIAQTLDNTLGAAYVGNIFAATLYGLTTLQTYTYYNRSSKDSGLLKSLVAMLWILDTLHVVLICHTVYTYAVTHFGSLAALQKPTWSVVAQIVVTGVSDGIIRAVFCYRIYILSNQHRLLFVVNGLASTLMVANNFALTVKCFQISVYSDLDKISWLFYFNLSAAVVSDALIAASMCWLLATRSSSFMTVNSTVRTLVLYSVNTGVITTLCTFATLVMYAVAPHTFIFMAIFFALSKLLLNSLLASLNARKALREQLSNADAVSIPLSSNGPNSGSSGLGRQGVTTSGTMQFAVPSTTSVTDYKDVSTSF
ncbi:hypothetical protein C8Q80DRAFT_793006 [Daedaleopsis nitida]|nr:hypothetical protein C8Q80DRAFT_793006 [Daedaleopsis nitida]